MNDESAISRVKRGALRRHRVPTYRTVLIAASVGVLIGLLLRR